MSGPQRRFYFGGLFGVESIDDGLDLVLKPVDFFAADDAEADRIMQQHQQEFVQKVAVLFEPRWYCMKNFEEMLDILRRDPYARLFVGAGYWIGLKKGKLSKIDTLAITYLVRGCPSEEELEAIGTTEPVIVSKEIEREMLIAN